MKNQTTFDHEYNNIKMFNLINVLCALSKILLSHCNAYTFNSNFKLHTSVNSMHIT